MDTKGFSRASKIVAFCVLLLIAIFVLPKYFPSLKGNGLLLVLLLCPLLHIFMMGKHGGHDGKMDNSHSCCDETKKTEATNELPAEHKHDEAK